MVASAVKLRRTSGRLNSDMTGLVNCQLLSEVMHLIDSGYLCLSPVWQLYPFTDDNDATLKKIEKKPRYAN